MRSADVRKTFLEFFKSQGHIVQPSSSVIPHGDRTLLFTNAGMVQFKDIFTGVEKPPATPRATTSQKCVRAGGKHNDLDNVGYTTRHLTFFEMLGNFSFGDYFKEEAIVFAWDLITKGYGLDASRLWATVYRDDDEAYELWRKISGLPTDRIIRLGEADNYWSMGDVGPCGPCSEILLDRGDAFGEANVEENGERFFEIWNLVFMQFDKSASGEKTALPRPSIDTGMGLERMAMVMQGVDTVFETDLLRGIISRVEELTGVTYDRGESGIAHRVLADHVRSLVFCLADGAELSNEGRGYVLRRILRRAARYGRKICNDGPLIHRLIDTVMESMGDAYPEIREQHDFITRQVRREEERFELTLDRGIELFEEVAADLGKRGEKTVPGDAIFKLYDTFGFPDDLVEVMATDAGLGVDKEGFQQCMDAQKERSRGASSFSAVGDGGEVALPLDTLPETDFVGYNRLDIESEVLHVAPDGDRVIVVLAETPFYGEGGGEVGDRGFLEGDGFRIEVEDTQKKNGRYLHVGRLVDGALDAVRVEAKARAVVDADLRAAIQRNHSATHLLHAALRQVLGTHVRQKGSLVEGGRLRFDLTHDSGISRDELARAEAIVQEEILANRPVEIREMDRDEAVAQGAMAFFGEKYGDTVRVVRMGDFSMELCGGCHVRRTGDIGPFVLQRESSVSAGVRRVEAITGKSAEQFHRDNQQLLASLAQALKVQPDGIQGRIEKLLAENRELRSKKTQATAQGGDGQVTKSKIGDVTLVRGLYDDLDGKSLRLAYDQHKTAGERTAVCLVSRAGGKVAVIVGLSRKLVEAGWKANDIFQAGAPAVKGRGGGRPEMVQAGGADPSGAEKALAAMEAKVRELAE